MFQKNSDPGKDNSIPSVLNMGRLSNQDDRRF